MLDQLVRAFGASRRAILAVAIVLCCIPTLAQTDAALANGLDWLQAQVQADGRVAHEETAPATPLQVRAEVASSLRQLGRTFAPALYSIIAADASSIAEAHGRIAIALKDSPAAAAAVDELESLQGADGGVSPLSGYQPSVLDTAWAARALSARLFSADVAIGWLQSRQLTNGSWTAAPRSPVYATASVLRALRDAAAHNPAAATAAASATAYLLSERQADGSWGESIWLAALVYEAVHDFATDVSLHASVRDWLLARQSADGSWSQDPYGTALALRALALTSVASRNPTLAGLTLQVVDSATAAPLTGATLTLTGASTQAAISDSGGYVRFNGIVAGSYTGVLGLAGYSNLLVSMTLRADQTTDLGRLQMSRSVGDAAGDSAIVSGTVLNGSSRAPLGGVTVSVSGTNLQAATDALGKYIITSVPPGGYTIAATKAGYVSAAVALTAVAGKEYAFSPTLAVVTPGSGTDAQGCRVYGTVTQASSGAPISSANIGLSGANSRIASSDAAGAFLIANLVSGVSTVSVSATGYDSVSSAVTLACDTGAALNYSPRLFTSGTSTPGANTASVSFTLVNASTEDVLVGVPVIATPLGKPPRSLVTGIDGEFTVDKLAEISVQIDVNASGFDPVSLSYQVEPLQGKDLGQLRLRPTGSDALLPDLKVLKVLRGSAVTDAQTLRVNGSIEVDVQNAGRSAVPKTAQVLAFLDADRDGHFDPAIDKALGQIALDQLLTVNQSVTVSIPIMGDLPFRDAPIHVIVDSNWQIAETNEANNVQSTADAAQLQPAIGTFNPVLKWHWTGENSQYPDFNQVSMAPVTGRVIDTNSDGKIDSQDAPVVVFVSYNHGGSTVFDGVIRVVHGATGAELLTIRDSQNPLSQLGSLALADLDRDGKPEIIALTKDYRVAVYRNDGTKWWVSAPVASGDGFTPWGGAAVADLDGDGSPEVLFGRNVFSANGVLKWQASGSFVGATITNARFSFPIVADLENSGQQNVILGASVYTSTGQRLWQDRDGFTAVADFDGNGQPSITVVSNGTLSLYHRTGQRRWTVSLPGGGLGGPPTIADVDGDGVPEIGVAASRAYTVFRGNGTVLWSKTSQDVSSQMTGSTVFDFDFDGSAEVLYADELRIRAYQGATGQILWEIPNSSTTTHEYPLVVDTDADGHADLVTVANDVGLPMNAVRVHGVRVFQDENNSWVNTRSVWNQHAYSITNVNDDLTIPARPLPSWLAHNTFRLNKRLDASPTAVADATASYLRVSDGGGSRPSEITVRVGNGGAIGTPTGLKVAFYAGVPDSSALLGVGVTSRALGSGEFEDVTVSVNGLLAAYPAMTVVVDDDGTGKHAITDFDRSNNAVHGDLTQLATSLSLTVATDSAVYSDLDLASFTATLHNAGSFAKNAQVRFTVLATGGTAVEVLPLGAVHAVPAGADIPVLATWPAAAALAGNYQVQAELVTSTGLVYASALASMRIETSNATPIGASLTLDKSRYDAADLVQLRSSVFNATANLLVEKLTATTTISNAAGQEVWRNVGDVTQLAPQALREFGFSIAGGKFAPGAYAAQLSVTDELGGQRAGSSAGFTVLGTDQSGIGLRGSLQVPGVAVAIGDVVAISAAAVNAGNTALTNLPLKLRIVNPGSGQLLAEFSYSTSIDVNASYATSANWTSTGSPGTVVVVWVAVVGGREVILAQEIFTLTSEERDEILAVGVVKPDARVLVFATCPSSRSWHADDDDDEHDSDREDHEHVNHGRAAGEHEDDKHGRRRHSRAACARQRGETIGAYLDSLGVPNKVVTSQRKFSGELRCGVYNTTWISGGSAKLDDPLVREVRAAVHRGDGLILEGVHDSRNKLLHTVAGVRYSGRLRHDGYAATIPEGGLFAAGALPTLGQPIKFKLTTGQAQASFRGGAPTIVSNQYGDGHSMLFAFDLARVLEHALVDPGADNDAQWRQILAKTLRYLASGSDEITTGDVVALQTSVTNLGSRSLSVQWRATLPAGTQLIGSSLAPSQTTPASDTAEGFAQWSATLPAGASIDLLMRLQVNRTGGAIAIPVAIYSAAATSGSTPLLRQTVTHNVTVNDVDLMQAAITAIDGLAPTRHKDLEARHHALSSARQAQRQLRQGQPQQALAAATLAADELGAITSGDIAKLSAAQLAVAWSIEALSDQLCTTQRCIAASLSLSSKTLPSNTALTIVRRMHNRCPASCSGLQVELRLHNRRSGANTVLMSETLNLGSQAHERSAAWQASGQAGDTIDLRLTGTWQGHTWELNTDSVQLLH